MDSTAFNPVAEDLLIDGKFEDAVDVHVFAFEHGVKLLSLGNITGETVKKHTSLALGITKVVLDKANDKLVGHELTTLHDTISLLTEGGTSSNSFTEHVTGGQVADTKIILDLGALSSLAGAGGSNHDNIHCGALGAFVSTLDLSEEIIEINGAKVHFCLECCLS